MTKHIPVLLDEALTSLNLKEDSIVVDATLGYAGHSSNILKKIKRGHLFAFDQDSEAIRQSTDRLNSVGTNFTIYHSNFRNLKKKLNEDNIYKVNGFLFDLGVSSPELDEDSRGFSYHKEAKLDMRMNKDQKLSAYEVVNDYSEEKLREIFYKYGEDKYSRSIAKNICKYRVDKKIETTIELAEIIKNSVPMKERRKHHPARQIFQAIRIEVNDEFNSLEIALNDALDMLDINGVIAVISFHSLEDRIVKNIFKERTHIDEKLKGLPNINEDLLPDYELVNRKPITPSEEELERNPRSRSAKLRVIKRIKRKEDSHEK